MREGGDIGGGGSPDFVLSLHRSPIQDITYRAAYQSVVFPGSLDLEAHEVAVVVVHNAGPDLLLGKQRAGNAHRGLKR